MRRSHQICCLKPSNWPDACDGRDCVTLSVPCKRVTPVLLRDLMRGCLLPVSSCKCTCVASNQPVCMLYGIVRAGDAKLWPSLHLLNVTMLAEEYHKCAAGVLCCFFLCVQSLMPFNTKGRATGRQDAVQLCLHTNQQQGPPDADASDSCLSRQAGRLLTCGP
jgi:hypothetical protein